MLNVFSHVDVLTAINLLVLVIARKLQYDQNDDDLPCLAEFFPHWRNIIRSLTATGKSRCMLLATDTLESQQDLLLLRSLLALLIACPFRKSSILRHI
jgi:hypothetical protein